MKKSQARCFSLVLLASAAAVVLNSFSGWAFLALVMDLAAGHIGLR